MTQARPSSYRTTHVICLDWQSRQVRLDDEGFTALIALVKAHQVCSGCYCHFSEEHPNVSGNRCLRCFLADIGKRYGLTYQGMLPPELRTYEPALDPDPIDALRQHYWYLDRDGFVYISDGGPGYSDRDTGRDIAATLRYWKFPLPATAEKNGETIPLHPSRCIGFFGDFRSDPVLVLHYSSTPGEFYFLSQRGGTTIQINRRKPLHRQLLAEAEQALPSGFTQRDVYQYIAKRMSQEFQAVQPPLPRQEGDGPCD